MSVMHRGTAPEQLRMLFEVSRLLSHGVHGLYALVRWRQEMWVVFALLS